MMLDASRLGEVCNFTAAEHRIVMGDSISWRMCSCLKVSRALCILRCQRDRIVIQRPCLPVLYSISFHLPAQIGRYVNTHSAAGMRGPKTANSRSLATADEGFQGEPTLAMLQS